MKSKLELASTASHIFVMWSIALGAVLMLLYCIDIEFYPKGIDIGDGLFFIWAALTFGFRLIITICLFTIVGFSLYSIFYLFFNKLKPNMLPRLISFSIVWPVHVFSAFIFLISIISFLYAYNQTERIPEIDVKFWLYFLAAMLMNGFVSSAILQNFNHKDEKGNSPQSLVSHELTLHDPKLSHTEQSPNGSVDSPNDQQEINKWLLNIIFGSLILLVPFLFIKGFGDKVINLSIEDLGIKSENVSIYADKTSSSILNDLILNGNYSVLLIPLKDGSHRVDNVNVLFQGIGDVSKIEIKSKEGVFFVNLPADSFVVAKEKDPKTLSELSVDIYIELKKTLIAHNIIYNPQEYTFSFAPYYSEFGTSSSKPSQNFRTVLNDFIPELSRVLLEHKDSIQGLEVIGYASVDWKKSDDKIDAYIKNNELATQRALAVVEIMLEDIQWLFNKINVRSALSEKGAVVGSSERAVQIKIITRSNQAVEVDSQKRG